MIVVIVNRKTMKVISEDEVDKFFRNHRGSDALRAPHYHLIYPSNMRTNLRMRDYLIFGPFKRVKSTRET